MESGDKALIASAKQALVRSAKQTPKPAAAVAVAAAPVSMKRAEEVPASVPVSIPVVKNSSSSLVASALKIISEESGVALAELEDACVFADMGLDSLLSLVITSRFREELPVDVPVEGFFVTYPTVAELRTYLGQHESSQAPQSTVLPVVVAPVPAMTIALPQAVVPQASSSVNWTTALSIISEESGISIAELTDDCVFADMGIDSLLSLVIVSRFSEELEMDIALESIFTDYPTVGEIKVLFLSDQPSSDETSSSPSSIDGNNATPSSETSGFFQEDESIQKPTRAPVPQTTSVVLQGSPSKTDKTLFLFPDGAGSATSYAGIPRVDSTVCVVGLNSPYHRQPHLFDCTVDDLIKSYIVEIRRRQPTGPYYFGGWSAGGILAYRATQMMMEEFHETVASLVLIDSPVPHGLDRLPQHFYDYCNKVHLFGGHDGKTAKAPEWLVPHFNATIDTLHEYHASPLLQLDGQTPRVSMIWACDSVMDGADIPRPPSCPEDTEGMKFLTEARTDFSDNGWGVLFPSSAPRIERAHGANHFTMMRGEFAPKLASFIRESL